MIEKLSGRFRPLNFRIIVLLVIAGSAFSASAQSPTSAYSLDRCIDYALKNNKAIQNAQFDTYIAEKQVKEFVGVGLPQVTGNASFSQFGKLPVSLIDIKSFPSDPTSPPLPDGLPDDIRYQTARFGVKYNASVGADISQLLFDGSFFVGLKAAREFVNLSTINEARTQEETSVNVAKAYYGALVNEERSGLLTANLERLKSILTTTEALYNEGFSEKVDVDRLQIQYNNLQVEKEKVDRMVQLGYDLLKFQMGMPIEKDISLTDKIEDLDELPELSATLMDADYSENRIETQLLQQQINMQELNVKRNRAGKFGTLVAFGNYTLQSARPRFFELNLDQTWFSNSLMGLQYTVNLFDGLQTQARIQQSTLEIKKVRNNMDMFRESVKMESNSAVTNLVNSYADVNNSRRNLDLAKEVYRVSTIKYKEGVGSNLEVINAESTLMESQVNYLSSLYEYTLAQIELKRVKGEFQVQKISTTSEQ